MAQDSQSGRGVAGLGDETVSDWLSGWRLDALVTLFAVLLIAGVAWDFRMHAAGISFAEEGFLTESHVFFYSMFLALAATIVAATVYNRRDGRPWIGAIPDGYAVGVVGVGLFFLGGGGDYLWHSTFGFEEGIEGLTSPTHLMLATGASLFLGSPLRATRRRQPADQGPVLPALVSASLVVTMLSLFTAWANPLVQLWVLGPPEFLVMAHAIASNVIFTALLVGGVLVLWRDLELPFGSATLVFVVVGVATMAVNAHLFLLPGVLGAGLVGDLVLWWVDPSVEEPLGVRVFGAVVPAVLVSAYVPLVELQFRPVQWTVDVLGGAVVLAAATGILVSYLVVPSASTRAALRE